MCYNSLDQSSVFSVLYIEQTHFCKKPYIFELDSVIENKDLDSKKNESILLLHII